MPWAKCRGRRQERENIRAGDGLLVLSHPDDPTQILLAVSMSLPPTPLSYLLVGKKIKLVSYPLVIGSILKNKHISPWRGKKK